MIEDDLSTINDAPHLPQLDAPTDLEDLDIASRWAQAYVMEGSAVGGSFMIRSARKKLDTDIGIAFLSQLAEDAKHRWPVFVKALTESNIDGDQAVLAARRVFDFAWEVFTPIDTASS